MNLTQITSVTALCLDLHKAYVASFENPGMPVILAKGQDGTAIVLQATYRNRFGRFAKIGYLRFGSVKPVWVDTRRLYLDEFSENPAEIARASIAEAVQAANGSAASTVATNL
jgi:hypothetical protein